VTSAAPLARPIIAVVGRPNVGKSTLFNRLVGRRTSLVRDVPGVTRDRLYGRVTFERWQATVVDTGGFDPDSTEPLVAGIRRQILAAVEEADLVAFVVDARAGANSLDFEIARILRRSGRPVVLVANKVEGAGQEAAVAELYRLGLGEPIPVSAEHGRGVAEMLEVVRDRAPAPGRDPGAATLNAPHVAIVGRPNVGKSSLVNAMVGDDRVLVHEEPGTTRDAVDTTIVREGRPYVLVDTAGIRRKGRVSEALEKLSVVMALKGLERSQVAVVVLDAADGMAAQDAHIAGYAHESGRAIVVAVNKWDLVVGRGARTPAPASGRDRGPERRDPKAEVLAELKERLAFIDYAPVCFTSAVRGEGLGELFAAIDRVAGEARRRVSTPEVTRVLREAVERRPMSVAGVPLAIHSALQVGTAPPTFAVRINAPAELHFSYERYLVGSLRRAFGFEGSPIRLAFRRAPSAKRAARPLRRARG
jgi:GTPase